VCYPRNDRLIVSLLGVASGSEIHAIAQTPRASLVASVWECRRQLMLYQATSRWDNQIKAREAAYLRREMETRPALELF